MTNSRYDVFLAHNSADRALVEELAEHLRQEGLLVFLDSQEILPGALWQEELVRALNESRACLVCIGPAELGPWTHKEMSLAIDRSVKEPSSFLVIPVFLPGVPTEASLPSLLALHQLVDFRQGYSDGTAFDLLLRAIRRPTPDTWSTSTVPSGAQLPRNTPDLIVERVHSEQANRELLGIRQKRSVLRLEARGEAVALAERVLTGDLQGADGSTKTQVLQLAAWLHVGSPELLDTAKRFRDQSCQVDPTASTTIIDALIQEAEGETETALRILRDADEPEARGIFFAMVARRRGEAVALEWFESQADRNSPDFFAGEGWYNLAVALAKAERWEEASDYLANASKHRSEHPDLLYIEGVVNTALILRHDLRHLTLSTNLPPPYVIEGPEADRRRQRAISCFKDAHEALKTTWPLRSAVAREWVLWLRLTDSSPQEREAAMAELKDELECLEKGIQVLPLAQKLDIPIDIERYWMHLDLQEEIREFNDKELHARFALAQIRLSPREYLNFLEREEARLSRLLSRSSLVSEKIRALLDDQQPAAARQLLEQHRNLFDENECKRITLNIDAQEGKDPRPRLEELYASTHSPLDLKNLANYLYVARDWRTLRPLLEELFGIEQNLPTLKRLVGCLERDPESDDERLLQVLDSNSELVSRDPDLVAAKARVFFHLGRLGEARALSDKLLRERNGPQDLDFDIDLALQLGDWERFPGIVEREWPRREEHDAKVLIRLATLASETDRHPGRAVELLRLAARKGSEDPHILMTAYLLMHQLGREGEEVSEWLSKALALSSKEGPVARVELRKVFEEIMPKQQERARRIDDLWMKGEIPIHFASDHLNLPVSHLLLGLSRRETRQQDGRRRAVIPIVSGAYQPIAVQPEWRVGFDITSLMILYRLGILQEALRSFRKAAIPPETMLVLLNERKKIRFHQPSLVKAAEEIRRLIDNGQIRVAEGLPVPRAELAEEVGRDLAQLLEGARRDGGCVVRPRPIPKLRSFMNEEARIGDFDDLILSTLELEEWLKERGDVDGETHRRSSQYLLARDQGARHRPAVLEGPIYLDDLALSYLQGAGLLPVLESSGLDLRIHPSVKEEQFALISNAREREELIAEIEELRTILRDAMQSGELGFLRWHRLTEEEEHVYQGAPTLSQLMRDAENCDAAVIDDRLLQRTGRMSDRSGRLIPVICVLDVLNHLESQGVLSREQRHSKLHRLREAGFACIPVEPEELAGYLSSFQLKSGDFVESPELRVIRQTLARIRSLDIVAPVEAAFLGRLQLASIIIIRQLWADEAVSVDHALLLSGWVWQNIAPSPLAWLRAGEDERADLMNAFVYHLSLLLAPQAASEERLEKFGEWVQEAVLEPLLPANADIVDRLAEHMARQIESWSRDVEREDEETVDS
jgi:tetratricopeptide (TPR) repeat protein